MCIVAIVAVLNGNVEEKGASGGDGAKNKGWIAEEVLRQVRALREQNAAIKKELSAVRN